MNYTPRTIAFLCELLHPPLQPDPGPVQKVHNQMFESGAPAYTSFQVTQTGAVLSNPASRPGEVSTVTFLPDRFQFREELGGLTWDDFATRVRGISEEVARLRGIPAFLAQQVTVRTLVNPRSRRDSRSFLRDDVFAMGPELEHFDRDPAFFGLRLVFPPTSDTNNAFAMRIESYNNDARSLFVENQGTFQQVKPDEEGMATIESNIEKTYRFAVERGLSFIGAFDESVGEKRSFGADDDEGPA
ncbi:MAG: hypothetical protein AAF368_17410 [Planctomycetota bacterium]